jgi:hypothetical protein
MSRGILLMALLVIGILYGMRSDESFASEYGSMGDILTDSRGPFSTESSVSANRDSLETIVNQQNHCQGNNVICQNILTNLICNGGAVCIIGNLDPFLLALPN